MQGAEHPAGPGEVTSAQGGGPGPVDRSSTARHIQHTQAAGAAPGHQGPIETKERQARKLSKQLVKMERKRVLEEKGREERDRWMVRGGKEL